MPHQSNAKEKKKTILSQGCEGPKSEVIMGGIINILTIGGASFPEETLKENRPLTSISIWYLIGKP